MNSAPSGCVSEIMDHLARLGKTYGVLADLTLPTQFPRLLDAVRIGRDVPRMRGSVEQLDRIGRGLVERAEGLMNTADDAHRIGRSVLPGAIVGATGLKADVSIRAMGTGVTRAEQVLRKAAKVFSDLSGVRESAEKRDDDGTDQLTRLHRYGTTLVDDFARDPTAGWLADRVKQLREDSLNALLTRIRARADLRDAADVAARVLYGLAGQARLARLGPSPLPAVDELVMAHAGADDRGGAVLTAGSAERAAARLSGLSPADQEIMRDLLTQAKSPHERAYLLKALAAGHDMTEIGAFAAKIHPYGHDPEWLDQHLSPFAPTAEGVRSDVRFGDALWTQGDTVQCIPVTTIAALAETDPLYALTLTAGDQPGNPALDNSAAFTERLGTEADRLYNDGRTWWQWVSGAEGLWPEAMESLADANAGRATGVDFAIRDLGRPVDQDTVTEIARTVSRGVPVPLQITGTGHDIAHAVVVTGYSNGRFELFNPYGFSFSVTEHQFTQGFLDQAVPGMQPVPRRALLPVGE